MMRFLNSQKFPIVFGKFNGVLSKGLAVSISALSLTAYNPPAAQAQTTITPIYANSPAGDSISNASPSVLTVPDNNYTGPASEKWVYRNIRNNGMAGINGANPRSGNGSVEFKTIGSASGQTEIALGNLDAGGNPISAIGLFDGLTKWSADTYTASASIANQAPILRIELFRPMTQLAPAVYGQLVFDTTWGNNFGPYAYGAWQNIDLIGQDVYLRGTSSLGTTFLGSNSTEQKFSAWKTQLTGQGFNILSINAGMGSSSLSYDGFVDNYRLGLSGAGASDRTFNFEVTAVPEPSAVATLGLLSAGFVSLVMRRRRK